MFGNLNQEGRRELISAIISPVVWIVVAAFFVTQGFVKPEQAGIYWNIALIGIIAGVINFFISYRIVFGRM